MRLRHLRTLHMENPIGIGETPYFSWIIESVKSNVMQVAYKIIVSNETKDTVWDSDWVESDRNSFIPYQGKALDGCTKYIWIVEVKDNYGQIAKAEAFFETAILDDKGWKAKWVESTLPIIKRAHGFGNQPQATMFRKEFSIAPTKTVERVRAYVTTKGVYNMYLNGEKIGDRVLAPGYASYEKVHPYQTYDLTSYVSQSNNAIGFYVGDGWYFSPETSMNNDDTLTGRHALIFEIHVTYSDGSIDYIYSDESVKASYGPVISSDMFAGEQYDANKELTGWSKPDYNDEKWNSVAVANYSKEVLYAEADDQIGVLKTFEPKELIVTPKGECVIDFGQNMAGRVSINCKMPKGYKISLIHFEILDENGNFFNTILSTNGVGAGADQKVEYISSGIDCVYEPLFTYFGFRYVMINVYDENGKELPIASINKDDFVAQALSTKKENLGTFECSDERLNKLYSNIRWSQYSNMLSIPTDCPQREKAGWTGDAAIYIETALLNENVTPLFSRWMKSVEAAQQDDGMIPMVVPFNNTYRSMAEMMGKATQMDSLATSAGWGDVVIKVPWTMYEITGNQHILRRSYKAMKSWCEYIEKQAHIRVRKDLPEDKEKYLWNAGFHYGEWLIPSTSAAGFDDEDAVGKAMVMTSLYTAPIYGYYSVSTFAKIAKLLNEDNDYKYYSSLADKMKDAIQACLIGANGEPPAEFMGAYVLLLYFDLVPESLKEQYENHLVEMIKQNNNCLDTGFLATPYLLETLEKIGREDIAFSLLFQTKSPSWLYEVERGATTIWETWNAVSEDNVPQHVSMNHYSFGCVASWMYKNIGGISESGVGYRHFIINPKFDERISWANREYMSEQGMVKCSYKRDNQGVNIKLTIPCNATATLVLPEGEKKELGSGNYEYDYKF